MDSIIKPEDYKYFVERPESSFSPRRNKAIINETIADTEKFFKKIGTTIDDNLGNRIDMVSSYGKYRFNTGQKTFEDYVGKRAVAELIGEKILDRIRVLEAANKLGNIQDKRILL